MMIEVWNYYDGPLNGVYEVGGTKFYFQHDGEDFYPPEGKWRRYLVYKVEQFPEDLVNEHGWWVTDVPEPFMTVDETFLRHLEKAYTSSA